jgi:hypothetical protein
MTHYDLVSPRKGRDDKTRWHKVGAAFPRDKGGFSLVFDSLPLPDAEGKVTLMMWEAKPREERGGQSGGHQGAAPAGGYGAGLDDGDSIPFAPW